MKRADSTDLKKESGGSRSRSGGMSGNDGGGNGSGQGPPVRRPHPAGSFGNVPVNRAEKKKAIIRDILFRPNSSSASS
ncbi:hypothetical protein VNO80_11557 [Phaseolus coccineus]|uniref:Uncharacterized protein n=1 Tax=Phaseolus coccineus TaxID=3886 RepID=A0AAN9NGR8_PHACN